MVNKQFLLLVGISLVFVCVSCQQTNAPTVELAPTSTITSPQPTTNEDFTIHEEIATSIEDITGIWSTSRSDNFAYIQFYPDGTHEWAKDVADFGVNPYVGGVHWFEDQTLILDQVGICGEGKYQIQVVLRGAKPQSLNPTILDDEFCKHRRMALRRQLRWVEP